MISNMVKRYCYEDPSLIENYAEAINDTTQTWHCHHRVETIMNCTDKELKNKGCYWHRPAKELIFLTWPQHKKIHKIAEGKRSEETRAKMRAAHKGKPSGMKGRTFSAEHRAKLRAAKLGRKLSEDTKQKIRSSLNKPEVKEKLRAAKHNHQLSNETKNKISMSMRKHLEK